MTKEELGKEAYKEAEKIKEYQTEPNNEYEKGFNNGEVRGYKDGYRDGAEPREKRIEELEKACDETQKLLDRQIEATYRLDKENAELRKDKKELCHSISEGGKACVYLNEQLTKAKDHIKKLLDCLKQDTNDPQTNYYVCQYMDKAEQFLKE